MPVAGFDKPILLIGRENMNRAVQGDIVALEVFDEKEWKAPGDEVVEQESEFVADTVFYLLYSPRAVIATLRNDDADESEEESDDDEAVAERKVLQTKHARREASARQPTGRVVGIIKRNWRSYVPRNSEFTEIAEIYCP